MTPAKKPFTFPENILLHLPSELCPIYEKIASRKRLTIDDGAILFSTPHEEAVRWLADFVRKRDVGDTVYYANTLHIYPTNLCELSCPICSYFAKPGWKSAWLLTPQQIAHKVEHACKEGISEVHIVGGLWKECSLKYYKEVLHLIREISPTLHIKALTAVEYAYLSTLHNLSIETVFDLMLSWGLGSLPGGGAEILDEEIRKKIAPGKISSDEFIRIHKIAHSKGIPSNITMLFGHIEDPIHILNHLDRVRQLQDETGGVQTFVPLKYHMENNALGDTCSFQHKPKDIRRVYAISRLMLDNIRNIKVLWNYIGLPLAQEILSWGGNDLSSTALEEKIASTSDTPYAMTEEALESAIHQIGRIPQKTHSGYDDKKDRNTS